MELQHRHDDGIGLVHCGLCSSPSHVGENELNINSVGISVWSKCAPKCSIPLGSKWDKWYPNTWKHWGKIKQQVEVFES